MLVKTGVGGRFQTGGSYDIILNGRPVVGGRVMYHTGRVFFMVRLVFTALIIALILNCCAAICAPSFRGYTGLVKVPSANVLDQGEFSVGVMTEGTDRFEANDAFAMYGILPQIEMGVDSFQGHSTNDRTALVNLKYRFSPESESKSGYAVGIIDATDSVERTAYAVATKSLIRRTNIFASVVSSIRGHIGVGTGDLSGVFGAISVFSGNRIVFTAEWDSEDVNLGFRLTPIRGLRLHAALLDVGNRDDIGVGMSYTRQY